MKKGNLKATGPTKGAVGKKPIRFDFIYLDKRTPRLMW